MLRNSPKAALLAAVLLLIGSPAAQADELRATFVPKCPSSNHPSGQEGEVTEVAGVVAAVATYVASQAVDIGIAALKKAVNPGNATAESRFAQPGMYLAAKPGETKLSPSLACLVVAVGNFGSTDTGIAAWQAPFTAEYDADKLNNRLASALRTTKAPELKLYFEAVRVVSPDKTALTWKPVRLYVGQYLNDSFWAGSSRSTQIEMHLYKPGVEQPFFSETFPFDQVTKPMLLGQLQLTAPAGEWGTFPKPSDLPQNLEAGSAFDPFTLEVRVVEAPKPYALAVAFANGVEANKESVKQTINQAIDPNARRTADATGRGATITAITEYQTKLADAIAACTAPANGNVTDADKLHCAVAVDSASESRQKADASCTSYKVPTCDVIPNVPAAQLQ